MPSVVACPKCQTRYQVPEKALGKTIQCKKCGQSFPANVPATVAANVPATSAAQSKSQSRFPEISAETYKRFGLDGPFKRPPEILADVPSPPQRDILGNLAAEPGFADVGTVSVGNPKSKNNSVGELRDLVENPFAKAAAKSFKRRPEDLKANGYAFRSLKPLAKAISILHWVLLALVIIELVAIAGLFFLLDWRGAIEAQTPLPGLIPLLIGLGIGYLIMIAAFILLLIFMYRANANLWAMSTKDLKYTPTWTVVAWLIPFVSIVWPAMAMTEIYKASHSPGGSKWKSAPVPGVVVGWWICLLMGVTLPIAFFLLPKIVTTISKKQNRYAGVTD